MADRADRTEADPARARAAQVLARLGRRELRRRVETVFREDQLAPPVTRTREGKEERRRPARGERDLDAVPRLVAVVVHQREALQPWLCLAEHQPVRGTPD